MYFKHNVKSFLYFTIYRESMLLIVETYTSNFVCLSICNLENITITKNKIQHTLNIYFITFLHIYILYNYVLALIIIHHYVIVILLYYIYYIYLIILSHSNLTQTRILNILNSVSIYITDEFNSVTPFNQIKEHTVLVINSLQCYKTVLAMIRN